MATAYTAHAIWPGETCAILAGGPSMSQEIADMVRGKCRCIVINDTWKLAPWADVLYASDFQWWRYHWEQVNNFAGLKMGIYPANMLPDDVFYMLNGGGSLEIRRTHLGSGKNGGFQAVNLAFHFGVRKMLLCGFDMRDVDGKAHWHGEHPEQIRKERPYESWKRVFKHAAPRYAARGVQIFNCTPNSALDCFKRITLESALESLSVDSRPTAISA